MTSSLARVDLAELAEAVLKLLAELLVAHLAAGDANHGEPRGQPLAARKAVDGGKQLALRQVAGRAENDERRRARGRLDAQVVEERVLERHHRGR